MLWAARALGRPVRWCADRSESFLSDTQGRERVTAAALALDADGRFLALRVNYTADLGAYLPQNDPYTAAGCGSPVQARCLTGSPRWICASRRGLYRANGDVPSQGNRHKAGGCAWMATADGRTARLVWPFPPVYDRKAA